jgi:hypothetical protein
MRVSLILARRFCQVTSGNEGILPPTDEFAASRLGTASGDSERFSLTILSCRAPASLAGAAGVFDDLTRYQLVEQRLPHHPSKAQPGTIRHASWRRTPAISAPSAIFTSHPCLSRIPTIFRAVGLSWIALCPVGRGRAVISWAPVIVQQQPIEHTLCEPARVLPLTTAAAAPRCGGSGVFGGVLTATPSQLSPSGCF